MKDRVFLFCFITLILVPICLRVCHTLNHLAYIQLMYIFKKYIYIYQVSCPINQNCSVMAHFIAHEITDLNNLKFFINFTHRVHAYSEVSVNNDCTVDYAFSR